MKTIEYTTYQKDENGFRSIHYEFDKNTVTEKQFENLCLNALKYKDVLHYDIFIYYEENNYHISFNVEKYYFDTLIKDKTENNKLVVSTIKGISKILFDSLYSE